MTPGEKFYLMTPRGRVLLRVESDSPGYDISRDEFRDDYADVVGLDGPGAGIRCGVSKAILIPFDQEP